MSFPSNKMLPEVGSVSLTIARPSVVFPQPLSPTSPSVSPGSIAKLTPSTALTWAQTRLNNPCLTGKWTWRFLTSSRLIVLQATGGCSVNRGSDATRAKSGFDRKTRDGIPRNVEPQKRATSEVARTLDHFEDDQRPDYVRELQNCQGLNCV